MIRRDSKSGLCVKCVKKDDSFRRAASQAAHRRYADPAERERTGAGVRRAVQLDPTIRERKAAKMREIAAAPEWRQRNAEQCRERRLWEKGVAARTPESNAQGGRTFSQRHGIGSWCPPDYVEEAKRLRRLGHPAPEVRRMIEEQHVRDLARFRRKLTEAGY